MDDNLLPIRRLIEFGLELGVAQQMITSMNNMMQNMCTPGTEIHKIEKLWYVGINNTPIGPLTELDLTKMILSKEVDKHTLVWSYGMNEWRQIENVPEILRLIIKLPPAL